MDTLYVTTMEGAEHGLSINPTLSMMETIRQAGIDELSALCGGSCACATCHVYVDDTLAAALPPASADESEMLEFAIQPQPNSRLSCQIRMANVPNGARVVVAPCD